MLLLSLLIDWHPAAVSIASSCASRIANYEQRVTSIERTRPPLRFETVTLPLENATADLNDALALPLFAASASSSDDVRREARRCAAAMHSAREAVLEDAILYHALLQARVSSGPSSAVNHKLQQLWIERMIFAGVTLSTAARKELADREYELAGLANAPSSDDILKREHAIRERIAHLHGFLTWTDYALSENMVQDPMRVEKFLRNSIEVVKPLATQDASAMRDAMAREMRRRNYTLVPADAARAILAINRKSGFDERAVRAYFEASATQARIVAVFQDLLGLVISPSDSGYEVKDAATHLIIGNIYLASPPQQRTILIPPRIVNGKWRPAAAAVVTHWDERGSYDDVAETFAAFGTALSELLALTPYETLNTGIRGDFARTLALVYEDLAWHPDVIRRLSGKGDPLEPMPDELVAKLVAAHATGRAYLESSLLAKASSDLWQTGTLYAPLWEQAYADDLVTAFTSGTVIDPAIGMRLRETILAPAASLEPDTEVQTFLGRPMSPDAFYKEYTP